MKRSGDTNPGLSCLHTIDMVKSHPIPDPPPRAVVRLGQVAGALEGLIAGWIYGGINAVPLAVLLGAVIGSSVSVIAWRIRRRARKYILPLLLCLVIEIFGGVLIVLMAQMVGKQPQPGFALLFPLALSVPLVFLFLGLVRREILAAYRGLIAGVIIGSIGFGILMGVVAAEGFGGKAALMLFVFGAFVGTLMGVIPGVIIGSALGAVVGALVNVTRASFAQTYGSLAAAIGFGIIGLYAGEAAAGGFGSVIGVALGVGYGALLGAKLGKLASPRLLALFSREDERNPNYLPILKLGNARALADADPVHLTLYEMLLLAIRSHFQRIRIEQWETAYVATLLTDDSSATYSWPLPLDPTLIQVLKDLCGGLTERRERQLRLRLNRHLLDLCLAYLLDPNGERIDIRWKEDPEAAGRAERISNALHFIMKARASFDAPVRLGPEVA